MEAFQRGDQEAFRSMYLQLAPRVLTFLKGLSRDEVLAQDLMQTTFLKVCRARASFQPGTPLTPWIFAIARRTFVDDWRKKQRDRSQLTPSGELPDVPPPDAAPALNAANALESLTETVTAALRTMPDNQTEALTLLKVQGLTLAQAAEIAGVSVGAMKVRAHRAYERLRAAARKPGGPS